MTDTDAAEPGPSTGSGSASAPPLASKRSSHHPRKQLRPTKFLNWPGGPRLPTPTLCTDSEPYVVDILKYNLWDARDEHEEVEHTYTVMWSDGIETEAHLSELDDDIAKHHIAEFWRAHGQQCPHA